jgi:amino acid transporter
MLLLHAIAVVAGVALTAGSTLAPALYISKRWPDAIPLFGPPNIHGWNFESWRMRRSVVPLRVDAAGWAAAIVGFFLTTFVGFGAISKSLAAVGVIVFVVILFLPAELVRWQHNRKIKSRD